MAGRDGPPLSESVRERIRERLETSAVQSLLATQTDYPALRDARLEAARSAYREARYLHELACQVPGVIDLVNEFIDTTLRGRTREHSSPYDAVIGMAHDLGMDTRPWDDAAREHARVLAIRARRELSGRDMDRRE